MNGNLLLLLMGGLVVVSGLLCELMSAGTACLFGSDSGQTFLPSPQFCEPVTICSCFCLFGPCMDQRLCLMLGREVQDASG